MPTPTELKAALAVTIAVTETIRGAGEVPSGTIYAALCGELTKEAYDKMLAILTGAGLISVGRDHLIRWTGPMLQEAK